MPFQNMTQSAMFDIEWHERLGAPALLKAGIKHADMTDPDQADRDMLPDAERDALKAGRAEDQSKRHLGFALSANMRAEVLSESSFNRMRRVMNQAKSAGVEIYNQVTAPVRIHRDEHDEHYDQAPEYTAYIKGFKFFTMEEHIRVLARKPGSVAADARETLCRVYREGWADAVHVKYGAETESQRERREGGGNIALLPWTAQTQIINTTQLEPDIRLQLSIPELRWLRANQVQREAALAQIRWVVHCLFWCAYEARRVNPGTPWGAATAVRIPVESQQHWDDAVMVMHLYMRMLTRFVDANERKLVIKAVVWEVYWNDHHRPVEDYLSLVADSTEEAPKLTEFLHAFNEAEMLGIHDKINHAWHKARVFFLGAGAIRGLDESGRSNHAAETFLTWLRRRAVRAKCRADVEAMDVPKEDLEMAAQDIYGVDKWDDLTEEQREKFMSDWRKGQEAVKAQANADAERRRQAELDTAAANNAQQRAMMAFPKPDVVDAVLQAEYQQHNPDYQRKLKAAEEKKKRKEAAGNTSKGSKAAKTTSAAKKRRLSAPQSASASPAGPSTNTLRSLSDSDSSDDDDLPPARNTHKMFASDSESDSD